MSPHGAHDHDGDDDRRHVGNPVADAPSDRAGDGLDHLQAAAVEMIAAARAFLDVAEELVTDRARVAGVVDAVASVADGFTRARDDAAGSPGGASDDEPPSGPVEHIKVS
jgi:hypothetical protein